MGEVWRRRFLREQRLPASYLETAAHFFDPLAAHLAQRHDRQGGTLLVAVNGSQGSGKSTLCAYLAVALAMDHRKRAIALSLDDFYLTQRERIELAATVHPLLRTRGVPGTHDIPLLASTLDALAVPGRVAVPRFRKDTDDRAPQSEWDIVAAPVDIVLLEGWCLGARSESAAALAVPVNDLERDEDGDGRWRAFINEALRRDYEPLYARFALWVMLAAPGFEAVLRWRTEQERKLREVVGGEGAGLMDPDALRHFVAHFERYTRQCLRDLPARVDALVQLDAHRNVVAAQGLFR